MDLRSDTGSCSDDQERPESSMEKGPEFIFRKLLRQASSLVEVRKWEGEGGGGGGRGSSLHFFTLYITTG